MTADTPCISISQSGLAPAYYGKGPLRMELKLSNRSDRDVPAGRLCYEVRCGGRVMRGVETWMKGAAAGEQALLTDLLVIFFAVNEPNRIEIEVQVETSDGEVRGAWESWLYPPA